MNYVATFLRDDPGTQHRLGEATFTIGKGTYMNVHADNFSAATDLALLNKPEGCYLFEVQLRGDGR